MLIYIFISVADRLPPAPNQPYIYHIFYIHIYIYLYIFLSQLQTDFHLLLISLVLCELLLSVYAIPVDAIASARSFRIIQISMYLRIGLYEFMFIFVFLFVISTCSAGWKLGSSICQMSGFAHTGLGDPIKYACK